MIGTEITNFEQRIKSFEKRWAELAPEAARAELQKIWEEWWRLADEVGLLRRLA